MPLFPVFRARVFLKVFWKLTDFRYFVDRRLERACVASLGKHLDLKHVGQVAYRSFRWLPAEREARWKRRDSTQHRLTIVIVAYRQPEALACLLASLRCQTLQNFDVLVYHDGVHAETRTVVESFQTGWTARCEYLESADRYNDYGHSLRALGIQRASGEFVLITNGDNYYSPRCFEFAFDAIDHHGLDMVHWDMVHSHSFIPDPSNMPFKTHPLRRRMDVGAFLVRTDSARMVGFPDKTHDGDATYMELLMLTNQPFVIGKVEKTLMIHN